MVNKKKIWTKKEGTDEICTEPGSMIQVYPTSVNLKEDWEETANQEVVTSTRYASNSRRCDVKAAPEVYVHQTAAPPPAAACGH
ncbi:uncharacterized protein LOC126213068 isoform X6 [Schistocerca nitens]|uniref:uncharacterized protein LOC126213068 isoform X6 n=1 Tax=Schistocerca nitens TaxID=7011 RepID=UPI00211805F1|nr:uncharacterized protein LOC126213068 isoform X6 [Schistocerca nitens]